MGGNRKCLTVALAATIASLGMVLAPGASAITFSNTGAITIPTGPGDASPPASAINVSGFPTAATTQDIKVTLHGFEHTCPSDVGIVLMAPVSERPIELMSGAGDCTDANSLTFTFDSTSPYMPDTGPLASGSFRATSHTIGRSYPQFGVGTAYAFPGPAGGGAHTLASDFLGFRPNGTWNLIVRDFSAGDGGQITGGWTIDLKTGVSPSGGLGAIADGSAGCTAYGAPTDVAFPISAPGSVVSRVGVSANLGHTYVGDLDMQLLSPGGSRAQTIFSRTGATSPTGLGDSSNLFGIYSFVDETAAFPTPWGDAVVNAPDSDAYVATGRYQASTPGEGADGGGASTLLSPAFAGVNPNGTWILRLRDKCVGDTGTISDASLQIDTVPATGAPTSAPPAPQPTAAKRCKKAKKKRSALAAKKKGCKKKRKKH